MRLFLFARSPLGLQVRREKAPPNRGQGVRAEVLHQAGGSLETVGLRVSTSTSSVVKLSKTVLNFRCPFAETIVILPYRDRADSLFHFIRYIHSFLQAQRLNYRIVLVEQNEKRPFNRYHLRVQSFHMVVTCQKCFQIFHVVATCPKNVCFFFKFSTWLFKTFSAPGLNFSTWAMPRRRGSPRTPRPPAGSSTISICCP